MINSNQPPQGRAQRKAIAEKAKVNNPNGGPGCSGIIALPFNILGDLIKSIQKPETRRSTLILVGSVLATCFVCFGVLSITGAGGARSTPTPTVDVNAMATKAMLSAWSSYTQTAAALPTSTLTLTFTPFPTDTLQPAFTLTLEPTLTSLPTATLVVIIPTSPPAAGPCLCTGDLYNCTADFSSHSEAQACYNYCISVGAGDIHQLDSDGDGDACEGLP